MSSYQTVLLLWLLLSIGSSRDLDVDIGKIVEEVVHVEVDECMAVVETQRWPFLLPH